MSDDDWKFTVAGATDRPVSGGDTMIMSVGNQFFADVEGQRALMVQPLGRFLNKAAHKMAANVTETKPQGETLHHADFVMTTDPATVSTFGLMHPGCQYCEDGVANALNMLRLEPDNPMLVGQLFWAG